MNNTLRKLEQTVERILFPVSEKTILWQQLTLAVLIAAFLYIAGPAVGIVLGLGLLVGLFLLLAPSRLIFTLFITFMATSHAHLSIAIFPFAGVEWHPRELLLIVLISHWIAKLLQTKVRFVADPTHLFFILYALFFVQIGIIGLFLNPDPHQVAIECRYPVFLASYIVFVSLIHRREELHFYARLILWLTVLIAVTSIAFFAYTAVTGNVIPNVQNALGAFVQRQIGPFLLQSVRPRGHMFFEICVVVLTSLLFYRGLSKARRLSYLALIGLLCVAILIMFMRTAYVTLFVSLALLAFISLPVRRLQLMILALGTALGLVAIAVSDEVLVSALGDIMPDIGVSVRGRLVEIAGAWRAFKEHPILGAGMGSAFEGMGYVAKTSQLAYAQAEYQTVHNVWMYYLFKGGLLGAILVAFGLGGIFARGYYLIPTIQDAKERLFLRGVVAAYGGQLIASLAMPRLTYPFGHVFLAMVACYFVVTARNGARLSAGHKEPSDLSGPPGTPESPEE